MRKSKGTSKEFRAAEGAAADPVTTSDNLEAEFRVGETVVNLGEVSDLLGDDQADDTNENTGDDDAAAGDDNDTETHTLIFDADDRGAEAVPEVRANQVSDNDLRAALDIALAKTYPNTFAYSVAVFDGVVVFRKNGSTLRQDFKVTNANDGHVALEGKPIEVRSVTRFVDVENPADTSSTTDVSASAAKPPPFTIQTIIFAKSLGWNAAKARSWAAKHGFKATKIDETGTSFRLRQRPPADFAQLRTICLAPSRTTPMDSCRVKAVGGPMKSSAARAAEAVADYVMVYELDEASLTVSEDDFDLRANALARARRPAWSGKTSSASSRPSLADFIKLAAKSLGANVVPTTNVAALPANVRRWIASRSLLGDPAADNFRDLTLFPVVDSTGKLSETLLRAVLGGRAAQAKISDAARQSARSMARSLLNSQFGANIKASESGDSDDNDVDADATDDPSSEVDLTNDVSAAHTPDAEAKQRSSQKNAGDNENKNEENDMATKADAKNAKTPTREERIEKLVASEKSRYVKEDAEWLTELSDKAFDRIEVLANETPEDDKSDDAKADETKPSAKAASAETKPAVAAKPAAAANNDDDDDETDVKAAKGAKPDASDDARAVVEPKTAEEYVASMEAPPEIKRVFEKALEQEKSHRKELIATIRGNSANKFTEKQLAQMDTDALESIAALAKKPEADFTGRRVHTRDPRAAEGAEDAAMPMPKSTLKIGSLTNAGARH